MAKTTKKKSQIKCIVCGGMMAQALYIDGLPYCIDCYDAEKVLKGEPTKASAPVEDAWTCGICGESMPKGLGTVEHFKQHYMTASSNG
jgi:hypothetical protein